VDELTEFDDPAGEPDRTRVARPERKRGARGMDGPSQSTLSVGSKSLTHISHWRTLAM
jgi:hypothetical protein